MRPIAIGERIADRAARCAHAVEVAGVEQRDPRIEGRVDRRDAFVAIGRPVEIGHSHAPESELGDDGTGGTELARCASLSLEHDRS